MRNVWNMLHPSKSRHFTAVAVRPSPGRSCFDNGRVAISVGQAALRHAQSRSIGGRTTTPSDRRARNGCKQIPDLPLRHFGYRVDTLHDVRWRRTAPPCWRGRSPPHLEAGLASTDVARLVRKEWVLASSVLGFLEPESATCRAKQSREVFWVAEPRGLAAYQGYTEDRQQRLATLVVRDGEQLDELIDGWMAGKDWTVIVIPAREVVHRLLDAYATSGVGQLDIRAFEA